MASRLSLGRVSVQRTLKTRESLAGDSHVGKTARVTGVWFARYASLLMSSGGVIEFTATRRRSETDMPPPLRYALTPSGRGGPPSPYAPSPPRFLLGEERGGRGKEGGEVPRSGPEGCPRAKPDRQGERGSAKFCRRAELVQNLTTRGRGGERGAVPSFVGGPSWGKT